MKQHFGPWTTAMHNAGKTSLAAFWKHRFQELPAVNRSSHLRRVSAIGMTAIGLLYCCLPTLLVTPAVFVAPMPASAAPADDIKDSAWLLRGIRTSREALRSGVYEASGHLVRYAGNGQVEGQVVMFSAFDLDRGMLRFDRVEPGVSREPENKLVGFKIARTPERALVWDAQFGIHRNRLVEIHPPDYKVPAFGRFDPRTFGLAGWPARGVTHAQLWDTISKWKAGSLRRQDSGEWVAVFRPEQDVEITLYVDAEAGFTVKRRELRALDPKTNKWSDVIDSADVTWKKLAGVWVPERLELRQKYNGDESYILNLRWTSVNAPLPAELFEVDAMDVHPEPIVEDRRRPAK